VILHRDGTSRRGDRDPIPTTVPEVARTLRVARARQGLRIEDVSARTGLPVLQLEALESGTVDLLPDHIQILQTLRRYGDYLGLPGERLVLVLVDRWPGPAGLPPPPAPSTAAIAAVGSATAAVPAPATQGTAPAGPGEGTAATLLVGDPGTAPVTALSGNPPIDTGVVPAVTSPRATDTLGGGPPEDPLAGVILASSSGSVQHLTTPVPLLIADTGVTPAVKPAGKRRRRTGVILLRVLVGMVTILVLLGVAGLVVNHYRPQWLRTLHLPHGHVPPPVHHAVKPPTHKTTPVGLFSLVSTSANGATFHIRSATFTVEVAAVGSASWVQATAAGHVNPVFSATVEAGQSQTFTADNPFTVEVGSRSAHIFVSVNKKLVGFYFPTAAPFTMTFTPVG